MEAVWSSSSPGSDFGAKKKTETKPRRVGGLTVQNSPREDAQFEPKFKTSSLLNNIYLSQELKWRELGEHLKKRLKSKILNYITWLKVEKSPFPQGDKSTRPI